MINGNVFSDSADAMKALLDLHFPSPATVLDATASFGVFYAKVEGRRVFKGDIREEVGPDYIGSMTCLPIRSDAVDVAVLDPPYKRGSRNTGGTEDVYTRRYGKAPNNENKATKLYETAIPELLRVARQGVIVKLQDAADGHSFHDRRFLVTEFVKKATGLLPMDVCLVYRPAPIKTLTNGRRHFFRQQVSYFLVWKWRRKSPRFTQMRW